jgi:SAM-dependent methyltransferase
VSTGAISGRCAGHFFLRPLELVMDAKLNRIERKKQERKAAVVPEPPDIAALAQLVAGKTLDLADNAPAVFEFLKRAGLTHLFAMRLLESGTQASAQHVIRLAGLHLHLERMGLWNDATRVAVGRIERQLARALMPSQFQNYEKEFVVPQYLRKGRYKNDQMASIESAEETIRTLAHEMGVLDLSEKTVLDIGCGVKFTQAFYGRNVPVKQYHGVDVDGPMIDFLVSNVFDDKFSYKHIDVYNEMYHKSGAALSAQTNIGASGRQFDLICLFSVFTHFAPKDYMAMLKLTRNYVAPKGKLIYTAFIDNRIRGKFKDAFAVQPLLKAVYKKDAVRAMLAAARWKPTRFFKHGSAKMWIVCEPCHAATGPRT